MVTQASPTICRAYGCPVAARKRGYCDAHYMKVWRYGDPFGGRVIRMKCRLAGCEKRHYGRGYCQKHYMRLYRHGNPLHVELGRKERAAL